MGFFDFFIAPRRVRELEAELTAIYDKGWFFPNLPHPRDIIPSKDIEFNSFAGRLTISNLPKDTIVADIKNTKSMLPFFGKGHNAAIIPLPKADAPYRYEDLMPGDIVIYDDGYRLVCHPIIKITTDDKGRRYRLKGYSTSRADPYIIRDRNIKYLFVQVVY